MKLRIYLSSFFFVGREWTKPGLFQSIVKLRMNLSPCFLSFAGRERTKTCSFQSIVKLRMYLSPGCSERWTKLLVVQSIVKLRMPVLLLPLSTST